MLQVAGRAFWRLGGRTAGWSVGRLSGQMADMGGWADWVAGSATDSGRLAKQPEGWGFGGRALAGSAGWHCRSRARMGAPGGSETKGEKDQGDLVTAKV